VASSGGEYFQVSFANKADSDDAYFLIQRQFETDDSGRLYIESHEQSLCGHFRIRRAELGRDLLRLQIQSQSAKTIQIRFQADGAAYQRLKQVLKIMIPGGALRIE
jgi:hypothetical protein